MKTQGEGSHLQAKEKDLGRTQPYWYLDFRLLTSRIVRKLKEEMAILSSILARIIPWTEESDGLQSIGTAKSWTQLSDWTFTLTEMSQSVVLCCGSPSKLIHVFFDESTLWPLENVPFYLWQYFSFQDPPFLFLLISVFIVHIFILLIFNICASFNIVHFFVMLVCSSIF